MQSHATAFLDTHKRRIRILVASDPAARRFAIWPAGGGRLGDRDRLSWTDNSSNEIGFQIQRSLDNSTLSVLATVAQNAIAYADTRLAAGTTYYYRVNSFNTSGSSAVSNVASATTSGLSLPFIEHFDTTTPSRPAGWSRWDSLGQAPMAWWPMRGAVRAQITNHPQRRYANYSFGIPSSSKDCSVTVSTSAPSSNDPTTYSVGVLARHGRSARRRFQATP